MKTEHGTDTVLFLRHFFLLMILAFIPPLLYPQYLEPGDIDVFINGQEDFAIELAEHTKISDMAGWLSFANRMKKIREDFTELFEGKMNEKEFEGFQKTYRSFLDTARGTPDGFSKGIEKMGFQGNGHQKYWTITFGAMCFDREKENGITEEVWGKVSDLIDRQDLELIKSRMEDIRNM
jgi:hypothetical protein